MKYIAKRVPTDTKLADLVRDLDSKREGASKITDENQRKWYIKGLQEAIDSISLYFQKSTKVTVSPESAAAAAHSGTTPLRAASSALAVAHPAKPQQGAD